MKRGSIAGAFVGGVAVVTLAACGSTAPISLKSVKLAMAYKAGEIHKYTMNMTMSGTTGAGGQSFPLESTMKATETMKVVSVDADGTATVDMTIDSITGTSNGKPLPATVSKPITSQIKIAKDGTVLGGTGVGNLLAGSGTGSAGSDQFSALLPDHEVHKGDKWTKTSSQKNPLGDGQITVTTNSSYIRDQDVKGHSDAVIESRSTIPMDVTIDFAKAMGALGSVMPSGSSGSSGSFASQFKGVTAVEKGTMTSVATTFLDASAKRFDESKVTSDMDLTMTYQGVPAGSPLAGQSTVSKMKMTMDLVAVS